MSVCAGVDVALKAGQTVVGDLQHETIVHNTVGGLEFPMGEDDAVVEEHHALQEEKKKKGLA